jgi:hypothetical protein
MREHIAHLYRLYRYIVVVNKDKMIVNIILEIPSL